MCLLIDLVSKAQQGLALWKGSIRLFCCVAKEIECIHIQQILQCCVTDETKGKMVGGWYVKRNRGEVSCSWVMCSSTIQTPEWLNFDRLFLSYGPKIGSAQFYFVTARRFRRLSHLRECVNKRCDRCKPRGCYLSSVHVTDKAGNVINLSPFPFKLWHCFVIQPVLAANWWIFLKSVFDLIFFSYRRVQGSQWLIVFYRQRTTKKNKS